MNDFPDIRTAFENECQKNLPGSKFCIAVNSGTSALIASLLAIDVRGREVITTPFTFMATVNAILIAGGIPKFVDVVNSPNAIYIHSLINPVKAERAISEKTKVILPVHLFGRRAPNIYLSNLCKKHNLYMIEDAAQAFLKKDCGTVGDIGCFSFYKTKNLSTFEGGLISVNSDRISEEKIRAICNQGQTERYVHKYIGYNFRMAEPLALMGWQQLKLHSQGIRAELGKYSEKDGYYPTLCYDQPSFQELGIPYDRCPKAEELAAYVRSLNSSN